MITNQAGSTDDEPTAMPMAERTVWVYLVAVVVTSGTYVALMVSRLLAHPVAEISWVRPMLWTLGTSIVGTVLGTIGATVVGAVRIERRRVGGGAELASDVRDAEISGYGERASMGVLGVGLGATLVLAMLDLDTFWIGNLLFLCGVVGAIVEATTKIRLYRRGF
jgi:hypothetical protein